MELLAESGKKRRADGGVTLKQLEGRDVGVKDIMTMRSRVRARVTGRVQGVSYRWATRATARSLGLTGWVRNEDDGSVLLEAEGEPGAVERLVAWLGKGPPGARVAGVAVEKLSPAFGERDFEIRF
jgi:acylphosphatase